MQEDEWEIHVTDPVRDWLHDLRSTDRKTSNLVQAALDILAALGPALGRPLVDSILGSLIANMKELRPGSSGRSEIRILFVFDPWRSAILLVAGDKSGQWDRWYRQAIPEAERLYAVYVKEREQEERP
ncbi:type II toxin-antitoxin system RelE/ParE family toxin [Uniformispora flossi]|uniref:type II toxin-antitoxin system RelE/ParE family toxin n=1 Tax=Uniformispora flossi TaxID=3390723 RepID=UPI003C2B67AA